MKTNRLEAFSDGVLAIIITIMVLELHRPEDTTVQALLTKAPQFISYCASFIYVGIYWNNHHHLFQAAEKVNGKILWANLHLLFWLSLIPFCTSWIGKNYHASLPVFAYGFVLMLCAIAYFILQNQLILAQGSDFKLAKAIGGDAKGKFSLVFYILGMGLSFVNTWFSIICYLLVAMIWFIPDSRIEQVISN